MNKHYLAAILSVLAFSTIGPFVKILAPDYPLAWITFARAFFGFIFVYLIARKIDPHFARLQSGDLKQYAIVGVFLAATMVFYHSAFALAPLADVVVLNYTHVFLSPLLAAWVLRERMEKGTWLLLFAGFIGLVLVNPFQGASIEGNFLALGAGVAYAFMAVYMRKTDKNHGVGDVAWFLGFASLFLLVPAITTPLVFSLHGFFYLALAGIISTGLGYFFFNYALEGLRVHSVSILDLVLGTILGVVLSVLAFHEPLSPNVLVGSMFVVGAGLLFLRKQHGLSVRLKLPRDHNMIYGSGFAQATSRKPR